MAKFGTYDWLMQRRNAVSLILPVPAPTPPLCSTDLIDFTITTTSGNISVDWGDGSQETISSGVSITHGFFCPHASTSAGFWTNIDPCAQC